MSRKLPNPLTTEEQGKLISVPSNRYPTGRRNKAIMIVMLDCGLRASEVCNLTLQDLNLLTGELKVIEGKGKKDRVLWAGSRIIEAVKAWIEVYPQSEQACIKERFNPLFCTLSGGKISTRYLRAMLDRYSKRAGISKNVHPHLLRHTFATDLYRKTNDIRLVQKALGHADLSSTMIYTHLVDGRLEEALKGLR